MLADIFGCQHGDVFAEGLVDANSEDEFDEKLETLQERWKAIEERNPPSEALVKELMAHNFMGPITTCCKGSMLHSCER